MLTFLSARDFRNLEPLVWQPEAGSHLLLGGNGAGKTSLLEAVYVLATTRSLRTAHLADCCRHGADGFELEGEAETAARARLAVAWGAPGRRRAVNGSEGPLAEHLAALPVVAWTADDGEALAGPPALRRRLLDRGLLARRPAALAVVARFRRALAAKRALLAAGSGDLAPWNVVLAEAAAELVRLREDYAGGLGRALAAVAEASGLGLPPLALAYRPSPPEAVEGAAAVARSLARAEGRERRLGRPVVGPQLDDLELSWGGREMRRVASAGERKALSVLLAVAQGRVLEEAGRPPLHLLDDLDAELSRESLERVWATLAGARQVFATSARPGIWEGLPVGRSWLVEAGRLGPFRRPAGGRRPAPGVRL